MEIINEPRKIIQIVAAGPGRDRLVALCNDGTVWNTFDNNRDWMSFRSIPQPRGSSHEAKEG